jgi:hypothetical protein
MHPVLLAIVLAAMPSLLALLWLSWRAGIFDSNTNEGAPHRRPEQKHAAIAGGYSLDSAAEFPIAPEAPSTATRVRRSRRRAAARA